MTTEPRFLCVHTRGACVSVTVSILWAFVIAEQHSLLPEHAHKVRINLIALFMTLRSRRAAWVLTVWTSECTCMHPFVQPPPPTTTTKFISVHVGLNVTSGPLSSLSGLSSVTGISHAFGRNATHWYNVILLCRNGWQVVPVCPPTILPRLHPRALPL